MIEWRPLLLLLCPLLVIAAETSPYVGEQDRSIKSLSENEIRALRNGEGMGFARLAELNHYPGPRHVLDLADELGLSESQRQASQSLYDEMRRAAVELGEQLIQAERQLNARFAEQNIGADDLDTALARIGALRSRLRYVHLEAHLRQRSLLSDDQIALYDDLRGYGDGPHQHSAEHHPKERS